MGNWLVKASDSIKTTWNVVRSVGPFFISQSEAVSEAYARHEMRLASVEAGKELLLAEVRTLSEVKKDLIQRYVAAGSAERIAIKRDLDEITASLRQLKVGAQALSYISADGSQPPSEPGAKPSDAEVTQHWMDKFSELARVSNEPWREDLLSRALAAESVKPGSISTRALWLIGTLEEVQFTAFASILDLCSDIGGLIVPSHTKFNSRLIPGCQLGENITIGHLIFRLDETGLLADTLSTSKTVKQGGAVLASYGSDMFIVQSKSKDLQIRGVLLTSVGACIASFCERRLNPLGKEMFDAWLATLDKESFPQTVIMPEAKL